MKLKLLPFLQQGVLDNAPTEHYVTALRSELLEKFTRGLEVSTELLAALAGFCFSCEYVLAEPEADTEKLGLLSENRSENERLMLACYRPVEVASLPLHEIPLLRPLSNETSKAVGAQYEENPYPRWRFLPETTACDDVLDILVAGAGTGQEPLLVAKEFPRGRVIALDLSRASLAYGLARAREHSVRNIRFLQGDILDVALNGEMFDSIRCSGVLHHMAAPLQGLLALKSVLKPGGIIKLYLYSAAARRGTLEAIALRKARGIAPTADAIRRFRQDIFALPDKHPAKAVTTGRDFYSISGTRDLLFHVQEHNFTIGMIGDLISRSGMKLVRFGMGAKPEKRFTEMGFTDFTDLEAWEEVEKRYPGTFSNMYKFLLG